jgi:hypothetical protein
VLETMVSIGSASVNFADDGGEIEDYNIGRFSENKYLII